MFDPTVNTENIKNPYVKSLYRIQLHEHNKNWGGKRPGAGRKPTGRKQRNIRLTDEEFEKLKPFIYQVKSNHPSSKKL